MNTKTISYTAANSIPLKIFKNPDVGIALSQGRIPPIHVQIIPTNRCNLNCKFCSCSNRDKSLELSLEQIKTLCKDLRDLGCKSATITGGGEPLMHPNIHEVLKLISNYNIKIGLVTNGLLLNKLTASDFENITWCRISCSDDRSFDAVQETLDVAVCEGKGVDWAFSYVASGEFNPDNLTKYIHFANAHNFTHVRVVSDLCNLNSVPDMDLIRYWVKDAAWEIDLSKVIFQGRKQFDSGQKDCWISLLKPLIGADGYIYPCCGVQYAHKEYERDNPETMRMGRVENIKEIYKTQTPFCGSNCYRCYYTNYNDILNQMMQSIDHVEFV